MNGWKEIVASVAPTIATLLSGGNPLVGMAVGALSKALLGKADGSEDEIAAVLAQPNPDILARIKEAERDLKLGLANAGVKLEEIAGADRASARAREVSLQDPTTRRLAYMALFAFFMVLVFQFCLAVFHITVAAEVQRTLDITLGVLFAWVLAVKDYYLGSSAGSAAKNVMFAGKS